MPNISVVICCANVGDTLEPACHSVAWADELVIVDSGSTDETARIANQYADRYVLEPWRGYTEQKKFGASLCTHDWVLVLDGDEEVSGELADQVRALTDEELNQYDVLVMPRRHYVMAREVRAWWPDYQSRLIHRHRCTWDDQVLHDARLPSSRGRLKILGGCLIHKRHSAARFRDYFDGTLEDARLLPTARQMYDRGRRCHWWDLVFRPPIAFVKHYIVKHGWRDGTFGLLIAQKAAQGAQLKYATLWAIQNGIEPPKDRNAECRISKE